MDPELQRRLDEIYRLVKDDHRLLRAVRRHQLITSFWKIFLWLFLAAALAYGYFIYLAPLAAKVQGLQSAASNPFGSMTSSEFQKLLNSYTSGK